MRAVAYAATVALASLCGGVEAQEADSGVIAGVQGPVAICPFDDCYLTFVDEGLCLVLDQVFDPKTSSFEDSLNCIDDDNDTSYSCLNVLALRRYDQVRQADYSDPYILELMSSFEGQLDKCLPSWNKTIGLLEARQFVRYRLDRRSVRLGIELYRRGELRYDRMMLELSQE